MKAIQVDSKTKDLKWSEVPKPVAKENEALIRIHATAVNRADLLQRYGKYPPPKDVSPILGLEASGTIEAFGSDSRGFQIGQKVFCLLGGGGYAEFVSVPTTQLMSIPPNLSFEEAASIPEAFFTAFLNLCIEGNLKSGEKVLIHAAASGVGSAAVQLATELGAKVYATAGSKEKCDFVESLGALECIDYKVANFSERFGKESMDFVLDMVGQKNLAQNIEVLKYRGRLIMLSLISGSKTEIDLLPVLKKNLILKGSTLRDRSQEEKAELTRKVLENVVPLFESGKIKPTICQTFRIEEAQVAHDFVEANSNLGKVILEIK